MINNNEAKKQLFIYNPDNKPEYSCQFIEPQNYRITKFKTVEGGIFPTEIFFTSLHFFYDPDRDPELMEKRLKYDIISFGFDLEKIENFYKKMNFEVENLVFNEKK